MVYSLAEGVRSAGGMCNAGVVVELTAGEASCTG